MAITHSATEVSERSVQLVRRIEVPAKDIKWSGGGDLVAIIGEASFYVLRCDRDAMAAALESGEQLDEDGIEDAFELQTETSEAVRTGERHPTVPPYLKPEP
jgi:coatomer subunit beta'